MGRPVGRKDVSRAGIRVMEDEEATIDAPIGRDPKNRQRMAVVRAGRPAVTHFRVVERFPRATLLEVSIRDWPYPSDPGPSRVHRPPGRRRPSLRPGPHAPDPRSRGSFSTPASSRSRYPTEPRCGFITLPEDLQGVLDQLEPSGKRHP